MTLAAEVATSLDNFSYYEALKPFSAYTGVFNGGNREVSVTDHIAADDFITSAVVYAP